MPFVITSTLADIAWYIKKLGLHITFNIFFLIFPLSQSTLKDKVSYSISYELLPQHRMKTPLVLGRHNYVTTATYLSLGM